jgi:hypothetical protein
MKKLISTSAILILAIVAFSQPLSRPQLRQCFLQALKSRAALDAMQARIEKNPTLSPCEESYLGICNALQIQYLNGMLTKLKMLEHSRSHINKAVASAPNDAELRFMRFMLESNIPSFLGLSSHINEDLNVIFSNTDFLNEDYELKKMAMEYMASSKKCNEQQTVLLQKSLTDLSKKSIAQR